MLNFLCRQAITGSRKQVFAPEVKGHRKTGPFSPQEVAGGSGCGNNQPRVVDVCKMLLVVSVFTSRCMLLSLQRNSVRVLQQFSA